MCKQCGDNKCNSGSACGTNSSTTKQINAINQKIGDLQEKTEGLTVLTKALEGHPMWMLFESSDIALFDTLTGKGIKRWTGWALCDGQAHYSPSEGKNIVTPQMFDQFPVGAGGSYLVLEQGGLNEVSLTASQNGIHTHTINDPGHNHEVTDPGHTHATDEGEEGHSHSFTGDPHTHTISVENAGAHNHNMGVNLSIDDVGTEVNVMKSEISGDTYTSTNGNHTHDAAANNSLATGNISNSYSGLQVVEAFTGISTENNFTEITAEDSGDSEPHENRPPFTAVIFITKIF